MTRTREDAAVGRRPRLLRMLLAAYIAGTALVGFWPRPVDGGIDPRLDAVLAWLRRLGLTFMTYSHVEFTANIGFFIPLGFLIAAMLPKRRWWLAMIICLAASSCIEIGQGLFLPHRFASFGDVLANTVGGAVGAVVAWGVFARRGVSIRVAP
jgi:VanZ like family